MPDEDVLNLPARTIFAATIMRTLETVQCSPEVRDDLIAAARVGDRLPDTITVGDIVGLLDDPSSLDALLAREATNV